LRVQPRNLGGGRNPQLQQLNLIASAADSIALGDVVSRVINGCGALNLPLGGLPGAV